MNWLQLGVSSAVTIVAVFVAYRIGYARGEASLSRRLEAVGSRFSDPTFKPSR